MKCHICGSTSITHYKQKRRDGVWVVTARCENDHIPEKGKPFYSIALFDIASLPVLGETRQQQQMEFAIEREVMQHKEPQDYIEWLEAKNKRKNELTPHIRRSK